MRTTLYEKVFLDGFEKPSYVVVTLAFEGALPSAALLESAVHRTLERHPRLRSKVALELGVPTRFVAAPRDEVARAARPTEHEGRDLPSLERELLSTELDPSKSLPFELHVVRNPAAIVLRVHHAVIDASSGFSLLRDFARALGASVPEPRARRTSPAARARAWLLGLRTRPRLPDPGLFVEYLPRNPLRREPVVYGERVVVGAFARARARAKRYGATFSELLASSVLSAFRDTAAARGGPMPPRLGLMIARARSRGGASASFRAETSVVSVRTSELERAHEPSTLAQVRGAGRDGGHDDVALAALYLGGKLRRALRGDDRGLPRPVSDVTFTLSDLTGFGKVSEAPLRALGVRDVRVLASPTAFDHAGMIATRSGDDLRLVVIAHDGAFDQDALLTATLLHLGEP